MNPFLFDVLEQRIYDVYLSEEPSIVELDLEIHDAFDRLLVNLPPEIRMEIPHLMGNCYRHFLRIGAYSFLIGLRTEL